LRICFGVSMMAGYVVKKMPRWPPGKSNGNDVSVYFEVPVKFVPDDNQQ